MESTGLVGPKAIIWLSKFAIFRIIISYTRMLNVFKGRLSIIHSNPRIALGGFAPFAYSTRLPAKSAMGKAQLRPLKKDKKREGIYAWQRVRSLSRFSCFFFFSL
jgi:hypothetical protein